MSFCAPDGKARRFLFELPARQRAAAPAFQNQSRLITPLQYSKLTIKSIFVRRKRFYSPERRPFASKTLIFVTRQDSSSGFPGLRSPLFQLESPTHFGSTLVQVRNSPYPIYVCGRSRRFKSSPAYSSRKLRRRTSRAEVCKLLSSLYHCEFDSPPR
jgi:hypothetical protein